MSIKFFHYVFIVASIALSVVFGLWGLNYGEGLSAVLAGFSWLAAALLVVYGIGVYRKLSKV